ncbi:hypothetical protein [Streptomyces sp. bgisy060]|uniref:hypothetical protein n=1 Tax=Streptomyces sp. bgisy060 TaxID=3413775 RepID=UPI003EBCBF2C
MRLQQEAHRFRRALEAAREAGEFDDHPVLVSFPAGTCGLVSEFASRYLRERGMGDWEIVSAERHNPATGMWQGTHAWVRQGTVIVDVTADQFDGEGRPAVWADECDDWYRGWEVVPSWSAPERATAGPDEHAYEALVRHTSQP